MLSLATWCYARHMKVFLSYSRHDEALATRVRESLETAGLSVFDAQVDILPGDNWAATVAQALEESRAMVVLLTPQALESPHVRSEIQFALNQETYEGRLVPIVVGGEDQLPEDRIPWILTRVQYVRWEPQDDESLRAVARSLAEAA